ncbi:unnamed protein product [Pleuronectes platessa]|uniref:Laminin EGF-like domain-containing protein n=1 Tax=Pleuronectes platessa TaxID=8262 RepID=A0A9N7TMA9_PLEPL|nr:unnamed protein product [Pleuronectes platessa]
MNEMALHDEGLRCKCNLHANSCVFDKGKLGCECEHNTTGPDCSRCKRHYHGRAWSVGSYLPIPKGTANICLRRGAHCLNKSNAATQGRGGGQPGEARWWKIQAPRPLLTLIQSSSRRLSMTWVIWD